MSSIREIAIAKAIGGGGGQSITVEALNVSQNGTTTAPEGKAYSPVNVSVPNSYTQADEGKVVDQGALVAQTSKSITTNGVHDTTLNNSVNVSVPAGATVESLTVTSNGTYVAPEGKAYSPVVVEVPSGSEFPHSEPDSTYSLSSLGIPWTTSVEEVA